MKRAFALFAMAALLAGCASYDDDDYRGSSGAVVHEDSGSASGTISRNPDLEPGPMHSSERFPGQEALPSEERVPDESELPPDDIDRDDDSDTELELKGEIEN